MSEPTIIETLARRLVAKLDECDPYITDAFCLAYTMKGLEYKGPHYGKELAELREALK